MLISGSGLIVRLRSVCSKVSTFKVVDQCRISLKEIARNFDLTYYNFSRIAAMNWKKKGRNLCHRTSLSDLKAEFLGLAKEIRILMVVLTQRFIYLLKDWD